MLSDSIAPTRNAIHLSQMPITPAQVTEKENTCNVHAGVSSLLIMTLCGFMKGEGQSLCSSVCRNRKGRRGSNRTLGKLQIKCREDQWGQRDIGEIPPSLKSKLRWHQVIAHSNQLEQEGTSWTVCCGLPGSWWWCVLPDLWWWSLSQASQLSNERQSLIIWTGTINLSHDAHPFQDPHPHPREVKSYLESRE